MVFDSAFEKMCEFISISFDVCCHCQTRNLFLWNTPRVVGLCVCIFVKGALRSWQCNVKYANVRRIYFWSDRGLTTPNGSELISCTPLHVHSSLQIILPGARAQNLGHICVRVPELYVSIDVKDKMRQMTRGYPHACPTPDSPKERSFGYQTVFFIMPHA